MSVSIKPRIVVDTNIFISGTLYGGLPAKVLELIISDHVMLLMSGELAAEILRAFHYFPITEADWADAKYILEHHIVRINPIKIDAASRDPKDDMLLALSLAGHADYLVTGDNDLLVLRKFGHTQIVTPKQFTSIVSASRK